MPWHAAKSDKCSTTKPWAVIKDADGSVVACHATEDSAKQQVAALYANDPQARSPKTYTAKERQDATTMPDGSFPIDNVADLKRAIQSVGRAKNPAAAKAWIVRRAEALGVTELIPKGWRSKTMDFEHDRAEARSVAFTDIDVTNDGRTFRGYAGVYDQETDLGSHTESVARGAFRKAIGNGNNIPMLWDHNDLLPPFATTRGGTLRLKEDAKGLLVEADIDERHLLGPTLRSMLERGDVQGMSWGFVAGQGNSRIEHRGDKPHRELTGFKKLLDVSPTWDPAYEGTSAELRSLRALQMAESLEAQQQLLEGAAPQLEEGAELPADAEPGDDEAVDDTETTTDEVEADEESNEEARSGVDAKFAAAARRRRLQMMGLTLPKEFKA